MLRSPLCSRTALATGPRSRRSKRPGSRRRSDGAKSYGQDEPQPCRGRTFVARSSTWLSAPARSKPLVEHARGLVAPSEGGGHGGDGLAPRRGRDRCRASLRAGTRSHLRSNRREPARVDRAQAAHAADTDPHGTKRHENPRQFQRDTCQSRAIVTLLRTPSQTLAARGAMHRVASRRNVRRGREAKTPLYRAYCEFWRQSPRRKGQARRREALHHGLLAVSSDPPRPRASRIDG
ncbi:hypothetical protein ENSA5_30930 [Enhygromyxa salina]|uniref:Uncharacterized protein n=1 Tax=Enhygromyxa salina TaxID=215803 RepID=A0A2S9XYP1_9BACT|nr:hypothetical protein ENSA5_30930 [Enhygromyxa salina]